ncbi:hypothetical protein PACILC2_01900 [Paenibacillus cisolokensis]|uniref:Uncharacterized protein n=1 Tax=Paenibacillus cisolokensis TaxID=1658519 RepID=A0ABQ4N0C6_9BACL|nr:hypothetical protein PACILC2_01900 [Paenibacillus cisolokensis]
MEKFLAVRLLGDEAVESLFQEYRKKIEKKFSLFGGWQVETPGSGTSDFGIQEIDWKCQVHPGFETDLC